MEIYYLLSIVLGIGILSIFSALMYFDIKHKRLPNILIITQTIICIIFTILTEIIIEQKSYSIVIIEHIFSLIPISGFYLVIFALTKGEKIGLGDVKLGIPIAMLLPWQGSLITLGLSNMMALLVCIPLLVTKKIRLNTKISFGPFLIIACLLVFFAMKFFVNFF